VKGGTGDRYAAGEGEWLKGGGRTSRMTFRRSGVKGLTKEEGAGNAKTISTVIEQHKGGEGRPACTLKSYRRGERELSTRGR